MRERVCVNCRRLMLTPPMHLTWLVAERERESVINEDISIRKEDAPTHLLVV